MTKEVGTLAQIGAKVGDEVRGDSWVTRENIILTQKEIDSWIAKDIRIIRRATPDYMDGEWHDWHGGECPVPGDVEVEVEYRAYGVSKDDFPKASGFRWDHGPHGSRGVDITLFRVLNPQPTLSSPVRMVPQIVAGVYGPVVVKDPIMGGRGFILSMNEAHYAASTIDDLSAAIETLTQIRDAMKAAQ